MVSGGLNPANHGAFYVVVFYSLPPHQLNLFENSMTNFVLDFTQTPEQILTDLINYANKSTLVSGLLTFGLPTAAAGTDPITNTDLVIGAVAGSPWVDTQTVHYNRLNIAGIKASLSNVFVIGTASRLSDLIPRINALYGVNLQAVDYVNASLPSFTGTWLEEYPINLVAGVNSLLWTDALTLVIEGNPVSPSVPIMNPNLNGFTYFQPGASWNGYRTDFTQSSETIFMALLNNANPSFKTPMTPSMFLFGQASPNTGLDTFNDSQVTLTATSGSGMTGSITISYARVQLGSIPGSRNVVFTTGSAVNISDILPLINTAYGINIQAVDIVDGPLPAFIGIVDEHQTFTLTAAPGSLVFEGSVNLQAYQNGTKYLQLMDAAGDPMIDQEGNAVVVQIPS